MSLAVGTRLGPYEVVSPIGKGGMGEVYRARDTKLERDVAIKVLPEELAADEERVARFEREAKLLASLNHPNIASIHGFEESDGMKALVLELVEGPTLAERIHDGPISVEEALPIARQIAEALEAGHEAGVIHRDLKPANIKLREDRTVKVLDYGLAKALEGDTPSGTVSELSQSPTLTRQGTRIGVILGTAAYMSPEQAKGKPVDKRTDIWAYGVVLFEMLTGRQAFHADDVSSTLAKVIERDPDWAWLPRETPTPVLRLIQRALEKDRARRIPDIGIARLEIDDALAGADKSPLAATADAAPQALWQRSAVASAALVAAIVSGLGVWGLIRSRPDAPSSVVRTSIVVPHQQELSSRGWRQIAISPDGTHVVYTANNQLYVRALDALESRPLAGTDSGAAEPFFSPDGEWVGFYSHRDRALRKVAVSGGGAVTLAEIAPIFGASWGADDTIVFGQGRSGIVRVAADGGTPEVLVTVEGPGEASYPQMLPGGEAVLFTLVEGLSRWVTVERLATGERILLVEGGREARFLPTGHLLYALRDTLLAVPFEVRGLEVTGRPVELSEDVGDAAMSPQWTVANAAVSETGVLVYFLRKPVIQGDRTPVWVGRDGSVEALGAPARGYVYPHVSPDGTRVSFDVRDEGHDIWIWDLRRKALTRLTFSQFADGYGLWTADGQGIVFSSNRHGRSSLYRRATDGTGEVERLTESDSDQYPHAISPDGTRLVYREQPGGGGMDLHVLMLDGSGRSEPLITNEFQAINAEISPDGRWLAYQSSDSGRHEIYVRPFPVVEGGRWLVSTRGGTRPLWAPDGRELFYLTKDGVMGVEVETEAGFEWSAPAVIVEGSYLGTESVFSIAGAFGRTYDISRDGRRFLMIQEPRRPDDPFLGLNQIVVVQNWFEELKRLVPTDN